MEQNKNKREAVGGCMLPGISHIQWKLTHPFLLICVVPDHEDEHWRPRTVLVTSAPVSVLISTQQEPSLAIKMKMHLPRHHGSCSQAAQELEDLGWDRAPRNSSRPSAVPGRTLVL